MSQLINSKYDSIQIHLRSDDPDLDTDDTESSVRFTFQRVISIPPQTKALLSVLNCQIPNTFYNITENIKRVIKRNKGGSMKNKSKNKYSRKI